MKSWCARRVVLEVFLQVFPGSLKIFAPISTVKALWLAAERKLRGLGTREAAMHRKQARRTIVPHFSE